MPDIFNVTNWTNQFWFHTGGTRAKKYLLNPNNNKFYYFKVSQFKMGANGRPDKDFKYEFWSEIIAYEIGRILGINILKYDIAIYNDIVGCISESMINSETEELVEGIKFLQAYDPLFSQNDRKNRNKYTFQIIEKSLNTLTDKDFIPEILKIIVFDAIIGNGDRHQENWALISKISRSTKALVKLENEGVNTSVSKMKKWFVHKFIWNKETNKLRRFFGAMKIIIDQQKSFAPIYDNGSSLGRELSDDRVRQFLSDNDLLNRYILNGLSEIHWKGQKLSHFDLIITLTEQYRTQMITIIDTVITRFDIHLFTSIVESIDDKIPEKLMSYKMPKERKDLIVKLITSRYEMLKAIRQNL